MSENNLFVKLTVPREQHISRKFISLKHFFQTHTPLEQALATQSLKRKTETRSIPCPVHLVAIIASYIHHQHDPHVPAGATRLLRRLSQVAPMSVFACLGAESESIRDAYIHRLKSHVEVCKEEVEVGSRPVGKHQQWCGNSRD